MSEKNSLAVAYAVRKKAMVKPMAPQPLQGNEGERPEKSSIVDAILKRRLSQKSTDLETDTIDTDLDGLELDMPTEEMEEPVDPAAARKERISNILKRMGSK